MMCKLDFLDVQGMRKVRETKVSIRCLAALALGLGAIVFHADQSTALASDFSSLNLASGNAADVLVTDPSGNRTGFDVLVNQTFQQIPRSAYFSDALNDDLTGRVATETSH